MTDQSLGVKNLDLPGLALDEFCQKWKVAELSLFGSVLRDDFRADSDVDILIAFSDSARWTLFDFATMESELASILGRPVDLVSKRGVIQSPNEIRKAAILESARVVYAA